MIRNLPPIWIRLFHVFFCNIKFLYCFILLHLIFSFSLIRFLLFQYAYHEFHIWLMGTSITFLACIFTRNSQSVETTCSYFAYKVVFWNKKYLIFELIHFTFYFFNKNVTNEYKINSFFRRSNFYITICCCASLLKSRLPFKY